MQPAVSSWQDRIELNPEIMAGKPVVRGTRIPVERVLRHIEDNDRADLFRAFPELTVPDAQACAANAHAAVVRRNSSWSDPNDA